MKKKGEKGEGSQAATRTYIGGFLPGIHIGDERTSSLPLRREDRGKFRARHELFVCRIHMSYAICTHMVVCVVVSASILLLRRNNKRISTK